MGLRRKCKQRYFYVGRSLFEQIFHRLACDPPFPVVWCFAGHAATHIEKHHDSSRCEAVVGFYNPKRTSIYLDSEVILGQVSHRIAVLIQDLTSNERSEEH